MRRVRCESLLEVARRTLSLKRLAAVRLLIEELDRLDAERIAGLRVKGLGTEHLYGKRLPETGALGGAREPGRGRQPRRLAGAARRPRLHDRAAQADRLPRALRREARDRRPPTRRRLAVRAPGRGRPPPGGRAGCAVPGARRPLRHPRRRHPAAAACGRTRGGGRPRIYLELDAAALEPDSRPLLGLLAPRYLADGELRAVLAEARDFGQELRLRLDRVLRQDVLPVLGRELGRWARAQGRDLAEDAVREELEGAALLFVFRALFLLYAESEGTCRWPTRPTARRASTRVCERAYEESDLPDPVACALWDDTAALVKRMRTGHEAWDLPPYNGDLFAADAVVGAATLEQAAIPDAALGPALVALARDPTDPTDRRRLLQPGDRPPRLHLRGPALAAPLARRPRLRLRRARRPLRGARARGRARRARGGTAVADQRGRAQERGRLLHAHRAGAPPRAARGRARPSTATSRRCARWPPATRERRRRRSSTFLCSTRPAAAPTSWSRSSTSWRTSSRRCSARSRFPRCALSWRCCGPKRPPTARASKTRRC